MNAVFSNGMLARLAVLMAIFAGTMTYAHLGLSSPDSKALLSPMLAAAASYCVMAVIFFVGFGLLAMHWFGRRYWVISAVWGAIWLGALAILGSDWINLVAIAYSVVTLMLIGTALPKGGLTVPGQQFHFGKKID